MHIHVYIESSAWYVRQYANVGKSSILDSDGDNIVIQRDEELEEATKHTVDDILHLYIRGKLHEITCHKEKYIRT